MTVVRPARIKEMHKLPHKHDAPPTHRRVAGSHAAGPVRLGKQHEGWLYAISGLLCLSGLGWLIAHYFFADAGAFADGNAESEPWWLRAHGAAAMGFLIIFGTLLPGHIVRAWRLRKNHRTGIFMVVAVASLIMTGYALYYASSEALRPWISTVHWAIGIAATAGLAVHVWIGKRRNGHRASLAEQVKKVSKSKT
jgi:hypothetical protein